MNGVRAASLNGGLEADGSLAGQLEFLGPDGAWARDHAEALGEAIRQAMALIDLELDLTAVPVEDRVRVEFRLPDLAGRFSHLAGRD